MIYQVEVNKIGTFWRLNGNLHREDGPAVERTDGSKEWWLNDKQYTEEEFNRAIKKVIPEYTMEEAIKLIGHEFKININNDYSSSHYQESKTIEKNLQEI